MAGSAFGGRSGPTGAQVDPMGSYSGRMKTTPIPVQRSVRQLDIRGLTSIPAGKVAPLAAWGLLREDTMLSSRFRLNFEMLETVELLVNPVHVRVMAWLVPFLAFDRFQGSMDQLNRSYMKQPQIDGGSIVPFIETSAFNQTNNEVLRYLGKHARDGQLISTAYNEAYNAIWNHRAKNRSPDITLRNRLDLTLAKAFWVHQRFGDIVPDFDQAVIEGEVPLTVTDGKMPVRGIGLQTSTIQAAANVGLRYTGGATSTAAQGWMEGTVPPAAAGQTRIGIEQDPTRVGFPAIFAELADSGITVSLANIELARKTQAFAALRKQYNQHSDDYIIDLLMNGISVPEQEWAHPILLQDRSTIFGMNKRYASDSLDLTASVVNGGTFIDLVLRTPRVPTGGVIMITAEVAPEQLFERQQDTFMFIGDQEYYPEYIRDTLDPEKVDIVKNEYVDVDHATPDGTFGYAPLNHGWARIGPHIGGKFYRPDVDGGFDEDRQRIWAVETANPTLSQDFYLVTNLHQKPFVVTNQDNFEGVIRGMAAIEGNTVFGRLLVEASNDYEEIMEEAPLDTIDKPATQAAREPVEAPSMETPAE